MKDHKKFKCLILLMSLDDGDGFDPAEFNKEFFKAKYEEYTQELPRQYATPLSEVVDLKFKIVVEHEYSLRECYGVNLVASYEGWLPMTEAEIKKKRAQEAKKKLADKKREEAAAAQRVKAAEEERKKAIEYIRKIAKEDPSVLKELEIT